MLYSQFGRTGRDPFAEMRRLQSEMNQLFGDSLAFPAVRGYPPVNLWIGDSSVVVTAELPGLSAEDVELSVREDVLTIRGERKLPEGTQDAGWHRCERPQGPFSRTVSLPFRVDPDKVTARFENGLLEIEMQQPEADRPRKIAINGK